MKLLLILALLVPTFGFAANGSGNVSSVAQLGGISMATSQIPTGGLLLPDASIGAAGGYFMLAAGAKNNTARTADNFYPFYKNGVAYQVTAGKTAYCSQLVAIDDTGNSRIQLVSGTASIAWDAATVTGAVYEGGFTTGYVHASGNGAWIPSVNQILYAFGASTFPGVQESGTRVIGITLMCKEL